MFKKLLIANRGEIACRIIKTGKKLGMKTVAVYSEIDEKAQHVMLADESYCIGESVSSKSYLNRTKIIETALSCKAEAIHPGYGFLSEDTEFAKQCEGAQLIFIGPPVSIMQAMANKSMSKQLMMKAKVPVAPGYQGDRQDHKTLVHEAEKIGFPVLLKASAGGGGKGIRLVTTPKGLENALIAAKREATLSFDNDHMFLEKYIESARHVEIQIFCDQHGQCVHLFDRDCSTQRRYQKIIEEAPAPQLSQTLKRKIQKAAIRVAEAIQYVGAGTIEFLVDSKENFYCIEMNTRLQVEYPVTEMITGINLIEWQCRIASGENLPLQQKEIKIQGHAFEARLCAENPELNFRPSAGKLVYFSMPNNSGDVRIDTGFFQGYTIVSYYDPMIAKLVVCSNNRKSALKLLAQQLNQIYIIGVDTNIALLRHITKLYDFQKIKIHTGWIDQHIKSLLKKSKAKINDTIVVFGVLSELEFRKEEGQRLAEFSNDPYSPWFLRDNWRMIEATQYPLYFWYENQKIIIWAKKKKNSQNSLSYIFEFRKDFIDKVTVDNYYYDENHLTVTMNQQSHDAHIVRLNDAIHIFYHGEYFILSCHDPKIDTDMEDTKSNQLLSSPMPGTITNLLVQVGDTVKQGDLLITLEAMKIEHALKAPQAGTIEAIYYEVGDSIQEGIELLKFASKTCQRD